MSASGYVHGYSEREAERLSDQAVTLGELLHADTFYPAGSRVLECGCGTGAQTQLLRHYSPDAHIVSVDISPSSVAEARQRLAGHPNVAFANANLFQLPFAEASFDHAFVCFVLEHLPNPSAALGAIARLVRPGGTITAIEGDHGSWYCHPHSDNAARAVQCLVTLQARAGGDANIGRRLYPLMVEAGLHDVHVSPRMVYVDDSRPHLVEGFSKNTFIAMVEGVRKEAIAQGLMTAGEWDNALGDMRRAAQPGGTFCYTFFKGVSVRR